MGHGPIRDPTQNIVHRRVVDIACFHVPQVGSGHVCSRCLKTSGSLRRPLLVDARCRAAQHHKIFLQTRSRPPVQTVRHDFPPLFFIPVELECRQTQAHVVLAVEGIPQSKPSKTGLNRDLPRWDLVITSTKKPVSTFSAPLQTARVREASPVYISLG